MQPSFHSFRFPRSVTPIWARYLLFNLPPRCLNEHVSCSLSLFPATLTALLCPFSYQCQLRSYFVLCSFAAFYTPLSTPFPLFLSRPLSAPALPDHISGNSGFRPPLLRLSHTIFNTHLCHTHLCHTHTAQLCRTQLCHAPSSTHTHTYMYVTHHHTYTHNLFHTTLSHIILATHNSSHTTV